MMMPSVFGRDIFDDFMDGFAFPDVNKELYGKHAEERNEDRCPGTG